MPEIRLHLASEVHDLWLKTEEDLEAIGLPPPFWAFAWAGGQGLARYVLDHPETVRGKRVLDFASGSGLVAIAAAMAGGGDEQGFQVRPAKAGHGGAQRRGGHFGQHFALWRKTQQAPAFVLG